MRRYCTQVFSDTVASTTTVYTAPEYNSILALADRTALQVIADLTSGTTPTITVAYEHSSDGRNWSQKNGTAEVNAQTLVASTTNNFTGTEPGTNPSHGLARLRITLAGTNPQANVKIYATGRDRVP